jgi:hypothetical protein
MRSVADVRDEGGLSGFDLDIDVAKHFDRVVSEDSRAVMVTDFADG